MGRGSKIITRTAFTLAATLVAAPVFAQTSPYAFGGTFTSKTSADFETNRNLVLSSPGATLGFTEDLGLKVYTENRTQKFEFGLSGQFRATTNPAGPLITYVGSPRSTLRYTRQSANAQLDVNGLFWIQEVKTTYDSDPSIFVNLIHDVGELERGGINATLRTGMGGPLGLTFSAGYDSFDYTGTTNPAIFDNQTARVGVDANMRLSPVTQGTVSLGWSEYNTADAFKTNSQTKSARFSVTHDVRSALQLTGSVGYVAVDTTATSGNVSSDGFTLGLGFSQAAKAASIFGDASYDGSKDRSTLRFGGTLDMKDATLSASMQAVNDPTISPVLLLNADYQKQLPSGSFNIGLNQALTSKVNSPDMLTSTFTVGYMQQINQSSDLNVSLNMSRARDVSGGAGGTIDRATLSASYSQNITPDWDMSVGVRHKTYSANGATPANSAGVFVTLTRNIDFGF